MGGEGGKDKGHYASRTELQHPRGYGAGEGGMGRWVSWETAGYLGTPIASSPPHSSRGQRKKEAKLGSSCSSIKQFRVHFSPS